MSGAQHADFATPDETRSFGHGHLDIIRVDGGMIGRFQLEPGWRWSNDVKPIAGTDLCQNDHFAYQVSGTLRVRMADGTEFEVGPGEVAHTPPGHDAWVVGDEPVTMIDWGGATHYAER
ncbi:cupin domain-containing protein [Allosalinactinospora lopnorensis]|uniref:cupin domain-containing protein n=1 Tax=Allosalinactinospora lopnorensis TaxID=1352348 RepID=UPI0012E2A84A|nr:cupin domain-containing protein [Allosalinactinospora lopnorensis]